MPAPDLSLSADLAIMRDAVREAGALALAFRKSGADVWEKAPGDPVTEADLAVNALLSERLMAARPTYGWLSEETADSADARTQKRVWVVDPIDGTRAYIRPDDPYWCVGVAVVEDGVAVASAIYAPVLDQFYEARLGGGAFLNNDLITASSCAEEAGCRLIAHEQMVHHKAWPEPWPEVMLAKPRPNATLLRMAMIASGAWDGVVALTKKSDWDLAAGALLIAEAGGHATTHRGERFVFNRSAPAQQSLVAAGKALHPLLVRRTRNVPLPDPHAMAPA